MIRVTQQNSASSAKRYYTTADYYSEGQELVGSWGGKGASRLGLEGTVDKVSFERLCDNLNPMTEEPLTVRTPPSGGLVTILPSASPRVSRCCTR